ncbi:hypothetical protein BH09BAC6_BH09BAC6_29070 [soil metagenome]|jgi:hypothetical protein
MESLHQFLKSLSEENLKKIPATAYGIKEVSAMEMKLVKNTVNRTKQYSCGPFYKPITQIIDMEKLSLRQGEKD